MFDFLKNNLAVLCDQFLEHSTVERPAERPVYQERAPLSHADQMACAAGVIEDAVANFGRVRACQKAAARQLNAADYALQDLMAELATAMPSVAAETVLQTRPLAVSKLHGSESEPIAAEEDGALAA